MRARVAPPARRRRPEQGDPPRVSRRPRRASIRPARTTSTRGRSSRRSSRRCYTYDYLARPSKLVPLTAEALPQITDDGKTYTIKLQQGHLLRRRPGVQGQEARARRRRLRLFAEAPGRPEDPLAVGVARRRQDRRARRRWPTRRRSRGKFDYDAKIAGLEAVDRYTLRDPPQAHRLQPAVRPRARADVGGRARGHRRLRRRERPRDGAIRSAPVPTSCGVGRGSRRSSSRRIPITAASPGTSRPHDPADQALIARDEGQEDAADRPRRDQHHRGGPGAAARLPERRARPHEPGRRRSRPTCWTAAS